MGRTDIIISKLVRRLKGLKVDPMPRTDELLSLLSDAQLEVAQRGLAIKAEITFYTEAAEDVYDLGTKIFRIRKLIEPTTWTTPVEIINNEERWSEIVRSQSLGEVTPQPLYATVWNGRLKFWPTPTVTGEEIEVFLYLLPSRLIDEGTDPEVDLTWDNCLEYGVLDDLMGGDWTVKYENELSRLGQQNIREALAPTRIKHWSEIGF